MNGIYQINSGSQTRPLGTSAPRWEIMFVKESMRTDSIMMDMKYNAKGEAAGTHPKMRQSYSRSPRPAC